MARPGGIHNDEQLGFMDLSLLTRHRLAYAAFTTN
jgi:hypothetical protein